MRTSLSHKRTTTQPEITTTSENKGIIRRETYKIGTNFYPLEDDVNTTIKRKVEIVTNEVYKPIRLQPTYV